MYKKYCYYLFIYKFCFFLVLFILFCGFDIPDTAFIKMLQNPSRNA